MRRTRQTSLSKYKAKLKRVYGITWQQYESMLLLQNNTCAICKCPPPSNEFHSKFAVDHDHVTGKVRGLLCGPCNKGLGQFRDTPTYLRKAADYLCFHK